MISRIFKITYGKSEKVSFFQHKLHPPIGTISEKKLFSLKSLLPKLLPLSEGWNVTKKCHKIQDIFNNPQIRKEIWHFVETILYIQWILLSKLHDPFQKSFAISSAKNVFQKCFKLKSNIDKNILSLEEYFGIKKVLGLIFDGFNLNSCPKANTSKTIQNFTRLLSLLQTWRTTLPQASIRNYVNFITLKSSKWFSIRYVIYERRPVNKTE